MVVDSKGPKNQRIDFSVKDEVVSFHAHTPQSWKVAISSDAPLKCLSSQCYGFNPLLTEMIKISVEASGEGKLEKTHPAHFRNPSSLKLTAESIEVILGDGEKKQLPAF
jgi:hypothetical protein